jgi:hypothetical protein
LDVDGTAEIDPVLVLAGDLPAARFVPRDHPIVPGGIAEMLEDEAEIIPHGDFSISLRTERNRRTAWTLIVLGRSAHLRKPSLRCIDSTTAMQWDGSPRPTARIAASMPRLASRYFRTSGAIGRSSIVSGDLVDIHVMVTG